MALKPPIEDSIQHAVIDVFSVNDGKLSVEQQIEVYGKVIMLTQSSAWKLNLILLYSQ